MGKTICIDFDGVIHKYSRGYQDGSIYDDPIEGALEALEILQKEYAVVIFSTRKPKQILDWAFSLPSWHLAIKVIPQDQQFWNDKETIGVTDRKLPAMYYIDDRALRFTNWKDILNYVR